MLHRVHPEDDDEVVASRAASSWMVQSNRASPSWSVHGTVLAGGDGQAVEALLDRPRQLAASHVVMVGQDGRAEVSGATPGWQVLDVLATDNDTSGGSRLTEVNAAGRQTGAGAVDLGRHGDHTTGKAPNTSAEPGGSRSWLVGRARMASGSSCRAGEKRPELGVHERPGPSRQPS